GAQMIKPRVRRPEQDLQRLVWKFLLVALPGHAWAAHIPNGMYRTPAEAGILKSMGQIPGVPDLLVVFEGRCFWIELKSKRGTLSMEQVACHQALRLAGCDIEVCRSIEEVEAALLKWKIPLRASI